MWMGPYTPSTWAYTVCRYKWEIGSVADMPLLSADGDRGAGWVNSTPVVCGVTAARPMMLSVVAPVLSISFAFDLFHIRGCDGATRCCRFPVFLFLHHASVIVSPSRASAEAKLAKHFCLDNIAAVSADFVEQWTKDEVHQTVGACLWGQGLRVHSHSQTLSAKHCYLNQKLVDIISIETRLVGMVNIATRCLVVSTQFTRQCLKLMLLAT